MHVAPFRRLSTSLLVSAVAAAMSSSSISAQESSANRVGQGEALATITGELRVLHVDDFARGVSERTHSVRDEATGRTFSLRFDAAAPAHLRSGQRVTVRGRATGQDIYVAAADGSFVRAEPATTSMAAAVAGEQKTLVIVAHFIDKQVNPMMAGADCSVAAISDRMFTDALDRSVDDMYRAASFEKVSFVGAVAGPYTIDASSTDSCDTSAWARAADMQAAAAGYDLSAYPRKLYVMPSNSCPAAGLAEVGVTPSRAWVFTCDRPRVYAHELGHNLGMDHAADPTSEYGDGSDVMGLAEGLASFNAPHKLQMGWLPDSQTGAVTQGGVYDVAPLAQDPSIAAARQILKVAIAGSSDYYYLSYRHGAGFEANACCSYLDRLSIHRWAGGTQKTYLVATLADGATFTDAASGFTVTQLRHNDAAATVEIQLGTACGSAAPAAALTPREQTGGPGTTLVYDLSLTNNDGPGCASSAFTLSGSAPAGWTESWSVPSIQLAPGSTGSARWSVTSSAAAQSGEYGLAVYVTDSGSAAHSATASATYSVAAGDTSPPSAPQNLTAKTKARQVFLSWQAASDDVGVAYYRVWRDGLPLAMASGVGWTDTTAVSGATYTYFVTAHDAAGNVSDPSGSVLVRMAAGGKGR